MDEQERKKLLAEHRRQCLDDCRGKQFVRKTFVSYPSLRSIESAAWDEEHEYHFSVPYIGQEFDPENLELLEGGWDHEHCHVCNARIEAGDTYWQCYEPHPLELCPDCYQRLNDEEMAKRTQLSTPSPEE